MVYICEYKDVHFPVCPGGEPLVDKSLLFHDALKIIFVPHLCQNFLPILRPLRRLVSNFGVGRQATITIVYQSIGEFDIRWFRHVTGQHLRNAEIPNMLPIKGNAL